MELRDGSVRPGEAVEKDYMQRSTVHIKKCRFLEQVGRGRGIEMERFGEELGFIEGGPASSAA